MPTVVPCETGLCHRPPCSTAIAISINVQFCTSPAVRKAHPDYFIPVRRSVPAAGLVWECGVGEERWGL